MIKIRFVEKTFYRPGGEGVVFEVGSVHELKDDSALHWLNRGKAERVDETEAEKPEVRAKAEEKVEEKVEAKPAEETPKVEGKAEEKPVEAATTETVAAVVPPQTLRTTRPIRGA